MRSGPSRQCAKAGGSCKEATSHPPPPPRSGFGTGRMYTTLSRVYFICFCRAKDATQGLRCTRQTTESHPSLLMPGLKASTRKPGNCGFGGSSWTVAFLVTPTWASDNWIVEGEKTLVFHSVTAGAITTLIVLTGIPLGARRTIRSLMTTGHQHCP